MKTARVNRAPVQIRHSGQASDSGRDTLKKTNKQMKNKQKELKSIPDPVQIRQSGRTEKRVLHANFQPKFSPKIDI